MIDYPNHLARMDILARYHQVLLFQQHYGILFEPIPNLAMDLIVPPLAHWTGAILAGKVFLVAILCVYSYGCYVLAAEIFGHETPPAFAPLFFIYNSTFLWGLINYVAGVALFLVSFALWLRWRKHWTVGRFAGFSALVFLCYLSHLSSIAILGVAVGSILAWELLTRRARWTAPLISGCAALPAVLAYFSFMSGSGRVGHMDLNTVAGKLSGLLCIFRGYNVLADAALVLGLAAVTLFLLSKLINASANMLALLPGAALLVAYFACPRVMYTSSAADARFVWPAYILLALSFRIRIPKPERTLGVALIVSLFLAHVGVIWWDWHAQSAVIGRIVASFAKLPRGSTLYPAFFKTNGIDATKREHGLEHVACYAVITRDAYVPSVFAISGQQPLMSKDPQPFHSWEEKSFRPKDYQYMWAYKPPPELQHWLKSSKTLVANEGASTLWKLN